MKFPHWPSPKGYRNIKFGLERIESLLARLGNPHLKLPPVIHIAGTNGKGSTLSFLKAIFEENDYKVHCYTSPHLVNFNERIILQGKEISDEFLNEILEKCRKAAETAPKIEVTFFEGITAAAFLAFSEIKADILLLETGMGGRLDSTNVIKKNLLSIITPVDFDHTDFLGKTLSKIATEKAGIIKKNCPVIVSKQRKSALTVIEGKASELNSEMRIFGKDWEIKKLKNNFILSAKGFVIPSQYSLNKKTNENEEGWRRVPQGKNAGAFLASGTNPFLPKHDIAKITFLVPSLLGDHQLINASTAIIAALTQNKIPLDLEKIKSAITKAKWQGRLQRINDGKFYDFLAKNLKCEFELILDGSHNPQGAKTISSWLKSENKKKNYFIFAMLQDKDCQGFLNILQNQIDELFAIEITDESKSLKPEEILKITKDLKIKSQKSAGIFDSLQKIVKKELTKKATKPIRIIVCGSLYLAGNFLEQNSIQQ